MPFSALNKSCMSSWNAQSHVYCWWVHSYRYKLIIAIFTGINFFTEPIKVSTSTLRSSCLTTAKHRGSTHTHTSAERHTWLETVVVWATAVSSAHSPAQQELLRTNSESLLSPTKNIYESIIRIIETKRTAVWKDTNTWGNVGECENTMIVVWAISSQRWCLACRSAMNLATSIFLQLVTRKAERKNPGQPTMTTKKSSLLKADLK